MGSWTEDSHRVPELIKARDERLGYDTEKGAERRAHYREIAIHLDKERVEKKDPADAWKRKQ
jgi:hypothetical protein